MSPALEKERIDHQILNPIFSGTEPDRDTLAEYQIHLAAFFCISVPECLGRCVGKHPEKLWVKIPNYFCLSAYDHDRLRRPVADAAEEAPRRHILRPDHARLYHDGGHRHADLHETVAH